MKYLSTYNESLRDKMTPKSPEDLKKIISDYNPIRKMKFIIDNGIEDTYSNDELDEIKRGIKETMRMKKLPMDKIWAIQKFKLDSVYSTEEINIIKNEIKNEISQWDTVALMGAINAYRLEDLYSKEYLDSIINETVTRYVKYRKQIIESMTEISNRVQSELEIEEDELTDKGYAFITTSFMHKGVKMWFNLLQDRELMEVGFDPIHEETNFGDEKEVETVEEGMKHITFWVKKIKN